MENSNLNYEKFQKNIKKLILNEKYRKEKHDNSRIIFNREISPVQMYQNLMDNTVFTYKNRVPQEDSKVITELKGIKRNRIVGSIIQLIGVLLIVLFVLFVLNYKSIECSNNMKLAALLSMFVGALIFIIVGGFIRISGRTFMADYIQVWNKLSILNGPIEINCLKNGQLAIIKYRHRDKSCGEYISALNPDDTIWHGDFFARVKIPTYVECMYIIDSIESCTRTENGLMIESTGRYYGKRCARIWHHGGSNDNRTNNKTRGYVFTEVHISYRKEEIPAILENMEQLESSLINYGHFETGRNTFSPIY